MKSQIASALFAGFSLVICATSALANPAPEQSVPQHSMPQPNMEHKTQRPPFNVVKKRILTNMSKRENCVSKAKSFEQLNACFPHPSFRHPPFHPMMEQHNIHPMNPGGPMMPQ